MGPRLELHRPGGNSDMDVIISGRNVELNDEVREVVEAKIGRLDRFVRGIERADVVFQEEKNPRITEKVDLEVTLEGKGHHVRCKVNGPDELSAIDRAVNKLEKQLRKLKTKLEKNKKHNGAKVARVVEAPAPAEVVEPEEEAPAEELEFSAELDLVEVPEAELVPIELVRRKTFEMLTMSPEDAVVRMQLLDHSFYVFNNSETGRCSVVYLREEGGAGLINSAG